MIDKDENASIDGEFEFKSVIADQFSKVGFSVLTSLLTLVILIYVSSLAILIISTVIVYRKLYCYYYWFNIGGYGGLRSAEYRVKEHDKYGTRTIGHSRRSDHRDSVGDRSDRRSGYHPGQYISQLCSDGHNRIRRDRYGSQSG